MSDTQKIGARIARILLVEDDPDDAAITRRAFERAKLGNELTLVPDGEAALDLLYRECAERGTPSADMIILDLGLPKVDGRAVLQKIWADRRLRHIPVIVLTASDREDDLIQSYKGGAVAFLHKPVNVERLLKAVGDLHGYRLFIARLNEGI